MRNDLPSDKATNFNARMRETMMTYLGKQGDPLDRGVTLRDLVESGIVRLTGGRIGGGPVPLLPGDRVAESDEPDFTPPPAPTGFVATPGIATIIIEHDAPNYPQGRGHLRTRVYGVIMSAGDPLPTFEDAAEITQFSGQVFAYATNPSTTWRLWIKWETIDSVLGQPAGGTNGLAVTTGQDVALLLEALTGEITESQLFSTLGARIDLIDVGPNALVPQVAAVQGSYTVKIDSNGYVSGFGLASTANNSTPVSSFLVRADSFSIANPAGPGVAPAVPFIVRTTSTTIGGVSVPVGVYITEGFIQNGTISTAKIANAAIDDAKIANLSASKITAGTIAADRLDANTITAKVLSVDWAKITNANITNAQIANGAITSAKITDGEITTAKIANTIQSTNFSSTAGWQINKAGTATFNQVSLRGGLTVDCVGGNIELGNDVGPGAGHYGLSLSHTDFNNIFIRRADGVTFFRVNDGGANSITFDSSSGVLAIKGVLSASQIAVGMAGTSTTFFDPNQPTVPLNSNVNGFLAYNGDTGISTYVPQTCTDNKGVTYDCSFTAFAGAPITSTELEFSTGTTSVLITRRIRVGTVRFVVNAAGTVDHFLSIWYRYKQANGTYGSWLPIAETVEPQSNYGSASLSAVATLGVSLGQSIQFGFAATNAAGNYWNTGAREIRLGTITVTGTNF